MGLVSQLYTKEVLKREKKKGGKMKDWIDEEKERRQHGINKPLLPSEHEAVNSRYPGCTLEYCSECGKATGRAGRGDDSIFANAIDGSKEYGPLCYDCKTQLLESGLIEE